MSAGNTNSIGRRRRGSLTHIKPDGGDALALTFAYLVAKLDWAEERRVV